MNSNLGHRSPHGAAPPSFLPRIVVLGTKLGHKSSSQTLSMDNITGPRLDALEISCASQQETVCIADTVDATNLPYSAPSRDSEPQSAKFTEENEDRPGKRIALAKEQVALGGIIRAYLRPNEVRASSGVILPAGTNQAKVGENHQQRGAPSIQKYPQNGPAIEVIWKGNFEIPDCPSVDRYCEGIIAHPSSKVSRKAYSCAKQIASNLHFVAYDKDQFWPDIFKMHRPNRDDIALYFYPGNYERSRHQYSKLLKLMSRHDLMLRSWMGGVELLVFPSKLLDVDSQKLRDSFFMWGVFHRIKGDTSTSNAGAQTNPIAVS